MTQGILMQRHLVCPAAGCSDAPPFDLEKIKDIEEDGREMTPPEVEETRNKIKTWLTKEGLFKNEDLDEDFHFHYAAEYPAGTGRHISIAQASNREDAIVVYSRIRLAEPHKNAWQAMPARERDRLIWQMRYDLLFQESSFEMMPRGGDLEVIRFTRELFYDGLNKNKFMEALRENFKCELYVVWKFQEIFGDGQASRAPDPPEPMYR